MRASNLRAYARRDLARMRVRFESADTSVSYSVLQSFFRVILCKLWLVGLELAAPVICAQAAKNTCAPAIYAHICAPRPCAHENGFGICGH